MRWGSVVNPLQSKQTLFEYDPAGNPVQKTDAKGVTTAYQYDALNRLTKIDFPADTDVVYANDLRRAMLSANVLECPGK